MPLLTALALASTGLSALAFAQRSWSHRRHSIKPTFSPRTARRADKAPAASREGATSGTELQTPSLRNIVDHLQSELGLPKGSMFEVVGAAHAQLFENAPGHEHRSLIERAHRCWDALGRPDLGETVPVGVGFAGTLYP